MTATPKPILFIVIGTLATLCVIGMTSMAVSMFYKVYLDPTILTAFVGMTTTAMGALTGILVNTRQPTPDTTTVTTPTEPEHPATITVEPEHHE